MLSHVRVWWIDAVRHTPQYERALSGRNLLLFAAQTWAEDILEVLDAVNDRAAADGRGDELVIWFCIFANYQCGDEAGDAGPTLGEQLALDPFGSVLRSPSLRYMCLVVTSTQVREREGKA